MAVDKLVDSTQLDADLTSVANAIRTKGGTSAQLAFPAGFVSAVQAIPTGTTPTGTKQISITANGTTTEDVAAYANAEITVDVQGGGGSETGSFLGSGSRNATISVTSLKSHIRIWLDGVKSDDDLTSAPYGSASIIEINASNDTGFISLIATSSSGTAFYGQPDPKIGRWGGNTAWTNRVEFSASSIKIINATYSGAGVMFNGSFTYNWEAW